MSTRFLQENINPNTNLKSNNTNLKSNNTNLKSNNTNLKSNNTNLKSNNTNLKSLSTTELPYNPKYWEKFNNTGILLFLWGYTIFTWTLILYLIWNRNKDFFAAKKNIVFFPLLFIPYIYIIIGIGIDFQIFVPQIKKTSLPPVWNSCLYLPEKKDSWLAKYNFICAYSHDIQTINASTNIANRSYYLVYVLLLLMLVAQKSKGTLLNNNILLSFSSAVLLLIFITSGLMTLNTFGLYSIWVLQYMKAILCMTGVCIVMIIYIYFNE